MNERTRKTLGRKAGTVRIPACFLVSAGHLRKVLSSDLIVLYPQHTQNTFYPVSRRKVSWLGDFAGRLLGGTKEQWPCHGMWLLHLQSAVKIQPFSPVFLLEEYRAKAFCRLILWNFKEKASTIFMAQPKIFITCCGTILGKGLTIGAA